MLPFVAALGGWAWVAVGLVLIGLEMLAPGVFLIWLGLAALLTGAVVGLMALSWQAAWLVFAGFALASVALGWWITRRKGEEPEDADRLNDRTRGMKGRVFRLEETLVNGQGRVRVGDSSWRVKGPELLAGTEVRVVRIDGATLVVEKA